MGEIIVPPIIGFRNNPAFEPALDEFRQSVRRLLALAMVAGCRLAIYGPYPEGGLYSAGCGRDTVIWHPGPFDDPTPRIRWDHVMLAPGESPPARGSWTIYELVGLEWRGRSAR